MKRYLVAEPHGMCGGVRRALEKLETLDGGVFVLNEIVHNNYIVSELKARGVRFVESLEAVPPESTVVFSAHGVSLAVEEEAAKRQLRVVDASCPLVKSIHRAAAEAVAADALPVLIGHARHPEVEGILGQAAPGVIRLVESPADIASLSDVPPERPVRLFSQTTLDGEFVAGLASLLKQKYPQLEDCGGICYATRDRQKAVRELAQKVELMIVLGSPGSSNTNRLGEVAAKFCNVLRLDDPSDLDPVRLTGITRIGVTAGASVPDILTGKLCSILEENGFQQERGEK